MLGTVNLKKNLLPSSFASFNPVSTVCLGISRTESMIFAPASEFRELRTSSDVNKLLAPGTITILFWPLSSTMI